MKQKDEKKVGRYMPAAIYDIIKKQCNYRKMEGTDKMSYNKCVCEKCGSCFATGINNNAELQKEKCPNCGERKLIMSGHLSFSEEKNLFYSGG